MITTVMTEAGAQNQIVTTGDPAGPWSEPILVDFEGIDPDLAWDEDGNCWVHHAFGSIVRARIDDTTGEVLEPPAPTWSGTGLQYPEAPHLFQRDSTWYLLIAEGGTERGHTVAIARGPSPTGPWESCPDNPILSHRSTSSPVQNTGHADLVEAPDGSWWMVFLGVRPKGMTPGFHVMGRETFLAPVEWVDGWPVVGEIVDAPVVTGVERDVDTTHPKWIRLRGSDDFVGRRQQHHRFRASARVEPGTTLAIVHDDESRVDVAMRDGDVVVRARSGPFDQELGRAPAPEGDVVLRLEARDGLWGPDLIVLGWEDDDGFHEVGELDGRYLSTEVATGFVGRVVGVGGTFEWFEYEGLA
jgi:hypothetical protein